MSTRNQFEVKAISSDAELHALMALEAPIFRMSVERAKLYTEIVGRNNFRQILCSGRLAGGLALLPMGQFFGGKRVPMTGVALVGVAPEFRAKGVAKALMHAAMRELHSSGEAISVLYPATVNLYRTAGYELAGSRYEIRIPLRAALKPQHSSHEIRPIIADDAGEIRDVYARNAIHCNGNVGRTEFHWKRIAFPRGETATGYCVVHPHTGAIEGWIYLVQNDCVDADAFGHGAIYSLFASDLFASTPGAAHKLLGFLLGYRSMADEVMYFGSATDRFLRILPERYYKLRLADHWMLRITHLTNALNARGYPFGLSASIDFEIEDELIENNRGRYTLSIESGNGTLKPGGNGDLRMNIRALASLYTGFATPFDLLAAGQLELAPHVKDIQATLASAAAVFSGPSPWMSDFF